MIPIFLLTESNFESEVPAMFAAAEVDIASAEPLFSIEGERIASIAMTVPKHQEFYARRANELKALVEWLENHKSKLEADALRNLLRGARALSATDQRILIAGTKEILEVNQLIIAATLLYRSLLEIAESFKQMGWMVGHVTKLHVASVEDALMD